MPCQAECLGKYDCAGVIRPIPGVSFAPFVRVGIEGEGTNITVGNQSNPPGNRAVISSFEYGATEGQGVILEIFDEEGSSFHKFVEKLNKALARAADDYKMFVEFGWIITDCNGQTSMRSTLQYGGYLYFLPIKVTSTFDQGKIKFRLVGNDFQDRIAENRVEKNQGTESNKKTLKQAIRDLFAENVPPVTKVDFLKSDGSTWNFKESDGGPEGPKSVWPSDQQNALATVRKWIAPLRTEDDKGIVIEWNCESSEPNIIFWEGANPAPDENVDPCERNIGTYIVNGGDCSPVISFSSDANWTLSANAGSGGNAGGATSGKQVKQTGEEGSKKEKVGTQTTFSANQNDMNWRSPDQIVEKYQASQAAHENATRLREITGSFTAELKIQGDPSMAFPKFLVNKTVSIIYINPFHIQTDGGGCGDWLAKPICNEMLSNKNWQILGVNHQISLGQYVTTLKLSLPAPNADEEPDAPLGGEGGTVTFENAMP